MFPKKPRLIVVFAVLMTFALVQSAMGFSCEAFDQDIDNTLKEYQGRLGINVSLLTAHDQHVSTPPYDWIQVTVMVSPVVPNPQPWAETWYWGGVIQHVRGPLPVGIRAIDNDRRISACDAAKKLPPGFPLAMASGSLFWPLYPDSKEPSYIFIAGDSTVVVGAYSGKTNM